MENKKSTYLTLTQVKNKLEHFCAYQERCHTEVTTKLYNLKISSEEHDEIIVHLIEHNFLNEERFACSFARGKHRISGWGKNRILGELKMRKISSFLIKKAFREIDDEMYFETLHKIALVKWNSLTDEDNNKKNQKLIGYLHRKGYEMEYILDKLTDLQNTIKEP
ncbi:RecX family transcriptional regulator [Myroides sp. M-43]|uniref:regulatory protein RecX n=1 Tax=Myroides oncorhynchi TaxID=2893756 RepID=UPI001E372DE7|nr:regulatory protein RecX [Myroides oncorhynchi]MCC9042042.1 RecX family transcriptional regulator [Myroides oncorhynchi]